MNELTSIATNIVGAFDDDWKLSPRVEVIITVSEPEYRLDSVGELIRERRCQTFRFIASPKAIGTVMSALAEASECALKTVLEYKQEETK